MSKVVHIRVESVEGFCAAKYKVGDEFYLDKFLIQSKIPICIHALSALQNFIYALSHGVKVEDLGVKEVFVSCPDPGEPRGKGRVIFKIEVIE